jgi:hypothetical protein
LALASSQSGLGFERLALGYWGWRDIGRPQICEAVSSGGEAASFYQGQAVSFDWQEFFKAQIEECREPKR